MKRTAGNNVSNKKQVKSIGLALGFLLLVVTSALASYYFFREQQMLNLEIALWISFVLVVVLFKWGGFCYVEVEIDNTNVDVKYYDLFPIGRKFKRILIPIAKISQVKIAPGLAFIGRRLVITRKSKGHKIAYPAVGLAAFNNDQMNRLVKMIQQISVR